MHCTEEQVNKVNVGRKGKGEENIFQQTLMAKEDIIIIVIVLQHGGGCSSSSMGQQQGKGGKQPLKLSSERVIWEICIFIVDLRK